MSLCPKQGMVANLPLPDSSRQRFGRMIDLGMEMSENFSHKEKEQNGGTSVIHIVRNVFTI